MAAILQEEPPELSESGRDISPALDRIVRHCLEKDRDNRFQSAKTSHSPCRSSPRDPSRAARDSLRRTERQPEGL